ncbi:AbrB/MazE/SpoVT family DNA-binding domain-containing protein [Desulfobacca acetoxidans]|uniref:Transcriptional regulator, AbrB family n=1 Tax=Desulfobacca acetoxidans (strain ATCC 700848 / DSM 11109 / ASRB2) TaxID=880072 RepID=F2NGP4_DESAR|nr:AbrB/MazE/SpoVT family DNA-binding domain-containing protein [Desulfobacca acetoxidans]AEB07951.1 transcriptional regulator, AbrB family [Desulfobacca acetoxidans DSM 11109]
MKKIIISEKGQICLPSSIRKKFGLQKGDRLMVEEVADGAILLRPLPRHPLLALRGILKGTEGDEKLTDHLLQERAADREREEETR